MSNRFTARTAIGLAKISIITWIHPLFGGCWAMFFGPGRWLHKVLACSIFGNLLFLFLVILGYNLDIEERTELVAPDCVRSAEGALCLCEAPIESDLARIAPNTVYAAFDGVHRARFEFVSGDMGVLKEIGIADNYGRPWISVSLEDGSVSYNRYLDDAAKDPEMSLIDKDGDGVPDLMVNWKLEVSFKPDQHLTWHRIDSK